METGAVVLLFLIVWCPSWITSSLYIYEYYAYYEHKRGLSPTRLSRIVYSLTCFIVGPVLVLFILFCYLTTPKENP